MGGVSTDHRSQKLVKCFQVLPMPTNTEGSKVEDDENSVHRRQGCLDPLRPGRMRQPEVRGLPLLPEDLHGAHDEGSDQL